LPLNGRPGMGSRTNLSLRPGATGGVSPTSPRLSQSNSRPPLFNPHSPAPFDWLHFDGRSVKTTLNNIVGLDGLARERKWRSHCSFSLDVGMKARQGVEAVCGPNSFRCLALLLNLTEAHPTRGCSISE
jgi:hypothetical protein